MFGNPFITPTFDEFARFMAFAASFRSADLSRQSVRLSRSMSR